jgi:HEAT repeat protein
LDPQWKQSEAVKSAIPDLLSVLRDKNTDESLRERMAWTLGKIGNAQVFDPLISVMKDDIFYNVRMAASKALDDIDPNWIQSETAKRAISDCIATLKEEDPNRRYAAAVALGKMRDVRAVKPLISALKDWEDKYLQSYFVVVKALDEIDPHWRMSEAAKSTIPDFIIALKDKNPGIRMGAARALGDIGDTQAVEPLIEALKDKDWHVGDRANYALKKISGLQSGQDAKGWKKWWKTQK